LKWRGFLKTILLLAALIAFTCLSTDSVEARSKIEVGFKGGVNFATMDLNYEENTESRRLFGGGIFLRFRVNETFSIQPEILYMRKGTARSYQGTISVPEYGWSSATVVVEELFNIDYLEIPVLIKFTIPTNGRLSPFVYTGPCLGIRSRARRDITATATRDNETYVYSESDDIITVTTVTDFGLICGGGIDFEVGQGLLTFDARYTYGLLDLHESYRWIYPERYEVEMKSRVFSIMAGYSIPIGGK
jgi:outer membrane protein with beta-barrel domain